MNTTSCKNEYRYPGVVPFSTDQSHLFFGRKEDTKNLLKLIQRERLITVYGNSGLCKSSLINAGVVPDLIRKGRCLPLVIRFGAWMSSTSNPPVALMLKIARDAYSSPEFNADNFLRSLLPDEDSLWFHIKSTQLKSRKQVLLIFDQFEELFSYPTVQIKAFEEELGDLLSTHLPLRLRRKIEEEELLTEEEEDILMDPLDTKILFVIRSDRLHLLDRLTSTLPLILRNCYELKALSPEAAKEAILFPAKMQGKFRTPTFTFTPMVLEKLLDFLLDERSRRVEGILVQMLCEYYEKIKVEKEGVRYLDISQIGDPALVVSNYYEEKLKVLPDAKQVADCRLIEDGLVTDGDSMRLNLHESFIYNEYNIGQDLLDILVNNRLLRSEPFMRGGYTYELSHDRLVPAVVNARDNRRELELAEQRRIRAQKMSEEATRNRYAKLKARRQLRIVRTLLVGVLIAFLMTSYFGLQASSRQKVAQQALLEADEQSKEAKRQKEVAEERLHKLQKNTFNSLYEQVEVLIDLGECVPKAFVREMESISMTHPDSLILIQRYQKITNYVKSNCQ
mgnify:CR=1 FL=1